MCNNYDIYASNNLNDEKYASTAVQKKTSVTCHIRRLIGWFFWAGILGLFVIGLTGCDTKNDAKKDKKETTVHEFNWSKKKFPCDIPFKVLDKGNKTFPWQIQSITCRGQAKDKSGYSFVVKGVGIVNSKNRSIGSRTVTFVPEEKNSVSINSSQATAYIFPGVEKDESFEFEFKGLFPGYYDDKLFAGFFILND